MKYWRANAFDRLLAAVQPATRGVRMRRFLEIFNPAPGTRILDLGGTSEIWQHVHTPLDVTIVNLPGIDRKEGRQSHHRFTFLEGDATCLPELDDRSFDIVFSNSVIEHVGGPEKERQFAGEVRRLGRGYYVQTPSVYFPLEPHSGIPFWWALPRPVRAAFHRRWADKLPAWNEMVAGTVVIRRSTLQDYFPDATIETEKMLGVPKSYFAYRTA